MKLKKVSKHPTRFPKKLAKVKLTRRLVKQYRVLIKRGNALIPYHTLETSVHWDPLGAKNYAVERLGEFVKEFDDPYIYWITERHQFRFLQQPKKVRK